MVAPSIFSLLLVLLSPLLFLHSAGECPESFNCGAHNQQIGFPLSNTTFPKCGLYTVQNCTGPNPKLNLGREGLYYHLLNYSSNSLGNSIRVFDPQLNDLISIKSCDLFTFYLNWTLPSTPSISFTVSPNLNLYKCTTPDDYFRGYDSYRGCPGNTVYFNYRNRHQVSNHSGLPKNCAFFDMPVVSEIGNPNSSDLFSVLASKFNITFHVSKECRECHYDGGQCAHGTPEFKCLKEKKGGQKMSLILGLAVGIGGFVLLLSCCLVRHLALSKSIVFWKNKTEDYRNIEAFLKDCGSLSPKRYTYSDVKKMTNSFRIKLGQGGYGCVFKGKLENGSLVAVKVLKGLKGRGEDFINEVATISRTSHVNIVTLLGFCFEGGHKALIYEFMPNGSLDKFIHDGNSLTYRQLGWDSLYKIAVGIARGLEYLHRGCNTRILHFDIKPHNILLDEDFCPKISDFGLAKLCPQKGSIVSLLGARGTAGYIAPEVFSRNFGEVSHKSDVYSYGMMVLEMVGGRKNISVEVDCTSEIYFPHWIYKRLELDEELGLQGIVDEVANGSVRKMVIVGLWCIQTDPSHRPSMGKVVEMLEGSLESMQIPPKPFLSFPSRSPADSSTTIVVT